MDKREARYSLNDNPTRVRFFRAGRVGARGCEHTTQGAVCKKVLGRATVMRLMVAAIAIGALGATPAFAESCDQRCPQLREEGFSTIVNPNGTSQLCCCLVDESGQSVNKPLEQCAEIP